MSISKLNAERYYDPTAYEALTNIESPVYTDSEEGTYYNLQGQPVETPQRGIYIKKSKKIFIK